MTGHGKMRVEYRAILKGVVFAMVAAMTLGVVGAAKSYATPGQGYAGFPKRHHHHHMMMHHHMMNER